MQSGSGLGIKKEEWRNLSKRIAWRITHGTEGLFVPLALELPNPIRKSVRLVPETTTPFTPETWSPTAKSHGFLRRRERLKSLIQIT